MCVVQLAGEPYILEFYMGGAYKSRQVILVPEESFCFPSLRPWYARTHAHTHAHGSVVLSLSYLDSDFSLPLLGLVPLEPWLLTSAGEDPAHLITASSDL